MYTYNQLIEKLIKNNIPTKDFFRYMQNIQELEDFQIDNVIDAKVLGLDIEEEKNSIVLQTKKMQWSEQKFCIVDIETNGCLPQSGNIIEIGAVMLQNNKVIDEFNSLIFCKKLSETIVELTGITEDMLKNAPSEASVLEQFRLFLKDSVFVAHNVEFDYRFLSYAYMKHKNAPLLNRKLCTIELARKTIDSPKYGLQTLREVLEITDGVLHRALCDAKSAMEVFKVACKNLPQEVATTEDLISYTKTNQTKKRKKQLQLFFSDD